MPIAQYSAALESNHMRHPLLTCFLLMCLAFLPASARGDENQAVAASSDLWYVVLLDGKPAGWSRQQRITRGQHITTHETWHVSIRRDGGVMELKFGSQFVETLTGQPVEMISHQALGAQETVTTTRFAQTGLEVVSKQAGQTVKTTLPPVEGQWLTPAQFDRMVQREIDKGAKSLSARFIHPLVGSTPLDYQATYLEDVTAEVFGKAVPAQKWRVTLQPPGLPEETLVDERFNLLRSSVTVMGMTLEIVAADEALAKAQIDPPELLAKSLIVPTGRLDKPRESRSQVYRVVFEAPADPAASEMNLPRAGAQRVVWVDDQTATVVVDLDTPVSAGKDLPGDAERKASSVINSDDPKVKALVKEALAQVAGDASPADRAEALRRFVLRYIKAKDLSVGFATASEVARTRQGDCTEHAVLLAAMLRADGTPARTVTGLLYVEEWLGRQNVLGYHMWTQAWLDPDGRGARWVDMDATTPAPFDAGHIALSTNALSDDGGALLEAAALMGQLSIEIVSP